LSNFIKFIKINLIQYILALFELFCQQSKKINILISLEKWLRKSNRIIGLIRINPTQTCGINRFTSSTIHSLLKFRYGLAKRCKMTGKPTKNFYFPFFKFAFLNSHPLLSLNFPLLVKSCKERWVLKCLLSVLGEMIGLHFVWSL
jgi:hypothetical protein